MTITLRDEQISENVMNLVGSGLLATTQASSARAWPPVMIRDFIRTHDTQTLDVDASATIGYVADCLSSSPSASIAIYDDEDTFLGIAVDEDAMALIKRDGVSALDYPIIEAVQRNRPVCSITDSPFVVLNIMRNEGWDRVGVSEHGKMIGVVHRRHLVSFVDN
ncbi:CBS domain-containing protein [Rhodospirillales bacterium]|nr:CBS domain-containing protein [Rhodospirillales bacterium]